MLFDFKFWAAKLAVGPTLPSTTKPTRAAFCEPLSWAPSWGLTNDSAVIPISAGVVVSKKMSNAT